MSRHLIWILMLIIFILEGTIVSWIIPSSWQSLVYVSPHFNLVFILFIGLYIHRHTALIYGLLFGLLHDFIYYGHMLGIYSFGMGIIGYVAGLMQRKQSNMIFYNLLIIGLGQLLFEFINYGLNRLFSIINTDFQFAFTHYMLPSVLFNLLFALAIYVPMRKLMDKIAPLPDGADD
ncbi:Rod shape-determining protein MreD [compost metagenome]